MPLRLSIAAIFLLALSGAAFWPGYLSKLRAADGYTHVHAVLGATWLLLLAAQPLLIRASLPAAHRRVGRAGVLAGIAFVVSGVLMAHHSLGRMDPEQFAREGRFVYLPLAMAGIFAVALLMAVRWRSVPAVHGRFMAATALPLLDPLIARLLHFFGPPLPAESLYQVPAFLLVALVLFGLLRSLPSSARGRAPLQRFTWGVVVLLLGYFWVPHTAAWRSCVTGFRDLPIT